MEETIQKGSKIIVRIIVTILMVMYAFLSIISIIGTTHIDMDLNGYREYAVLQMDHLLITVLLAAIFLAAIILIDHFIGIEKIDTSKLGKGVILFAVAVGFVWMLMIQGHPLDDQSIVQRSAANFIAGDYSALQHGEYLNRFPHQLGIVFIFEGVYRIFGPENYQAIMVINIILAAGILNNLFHILKMITEDKKAHNMYWIMAAGCFQLMFYTFFVYGTIIGLFFATGGMYLIMKYFNTGKYRYYVLAFLALGISVMAKSNFQIFVLASFLVFLFTSIKEKRYKEIALSFVLLITLCSPNIAKAYYAEKSGMEIEKGASASLYIAMGLQEGDKENACGAGGWYNAYNVITLNAAGMDYDKADEMAKENISERLKEFGKNPGMAARFAFEKIATQWNEPTFQTFWMVTVRDNHGELSTPAKSLLTGKVNTVVQKYMKIYLLFMWLGNLVYYYVNRKKNDIWKIFMGVAVIGGFAFHFFWEGKALYIMPYFVISMVAGSQGLLIFVEYLEKNLIEKIKKAV